MPKLFFIAGIHGVGKTTICNEIANKLEIYACSASAIIKANKGKISAIDKLVKNIDANQEALLTGLNEIRQSNKLIFLDGHFVLLNANKEMQRLDDSVFDGINPDVIVVITNNVNIVYDRLLARDGKTYNLELLDKMQKAEIAAAKENAARLKIPFLELNLYAYSASLNTLSNFVLTNI